MLGYAANGGGDELALDMLAHLIEDLPIQLDIQAARLDVTALIARLRHDNVSALCIADLPPSPPSKTRYVVKRVRAAIPELRIAVGRWAPQTLADENSDGLLQDGATSVAATLLQTRDYLTTLLDKPRVAVPDAGVHAA